MFLGVNTQNEVFIRKSENDFLGLLNKEFYSNAGIYIFDAKSFPKIETITQIVTLTQLGTLFWPQENLTISDK